VYLISSIILTYIKKAGFTSMNNHVTEMCIRCSVIISNEAGDIYFKQKQEFSILNIKLDTDTVNIDEQILADM